MAAISDREALAYLLEQVLQADAEASRGSNSFGLNVT